MRPLPLHLADQKEIGVPIFEVRNPQLTGGGVHGSDAPWGHRLHGVAVAVHMLVLSAMLLEAREDAYDGEVRHARQLVTALERDILRSIELYELSMSAAAQGATNPRAMSLSEMRRRLSHRRRQGEKHDLRWPPGCDRRRQDGVRRVADRIARVSGHVEQVSAPLAALAAEFPRQWRRR